MTATVQRSEIDALIGQRVHHVLWRRKIQQRDLAEALGITQSTLSRRLRGESAWFAGDLVAVAAVLEVSIGWLFGEESAVRPKGLEPLTFWSVLWATTWSRRHARVSLAPETLRWQGPRGHRRATVRRLWINPALAGTRSTKCDRSGTDDLALAA